MTDRPNGWRNGGPWWARWGLTGVLVLGMLAVVSGIVPSALTGTERTVKEVKEAVERHEKQQDEALRRLDGRLEESVRVLRAICLSQAKTDWERRECLK